MAMNSNTRAYNSSFDSPKASAELSFSDWKRIKDGHFNMPVVNAPPPVRNKWKDDSFETYAPQMQPLPPPSWAHRRFAINKGTINADKQVYAKQTAPPKNVNSTGAPSSKHIARPTDNPIAPPPPPPDINKLLIPSNTPPVVPTPPQRLPPPQRTPPQIYVPRLNPFRSNNASVGPQRPGWIPKPPMPPPMHANTPESREEKQHMWRQYRQAMKPFKHREFHNAKRTVQRLSKKPESELDEKEKAKLQRAQEVVTSHKAMLNERAMQRGLQVQAELEASKAAAVAPATTRTDTGGEKRSTEWDKGKEQPASSTPTINWLGNSALDSSTADIVWR